MKKDQFETDIKDRLDALETSPPDKIWDQLDHQLGSGTPAPFRPGKWLGLAAAGIVALAAILLLLRPADPSVIQAENEVRYDTVYGLGASGEFRVVQVDTALIGISAEKESVMAVRDRIPEPVRTWLEDERVLLLYIRSDCKYCLRLEEETFTDPGLDQFIEDHFNMITLEYGDEKNAPFLNRNNLNVSPTLVVINERGLITYRIQGFRNATDMQTTLQAVLDGATIPEKEAEQEVVTGPYVEITDRPRTFKIAPNPSQGPFTIRVNNPERLAAKVQISTIHGQMVREQHIDAVRGDWEESFDLSDVRKGYYIIRIERGSEVLVEKILIQ
ncbi:T9SS type A sorting domain-containing protein [Flavilitoribacter nigricans]|uniref:Thioredoxin domain-containing protein n=1 Tax=Flavilitoribacter nigricans (strain ATCC 23147 / DSM 23189 / NBRC 102662 / NCIMB 1420 / SS-2) TaxID=1122177 RepID=A0A2D0N889_FLAN2|nr:T9SS type A sorting domain-containing protein [Flavilitoribacter nigricans]PHN04731.1 hypothetical protein CRP01_19645 [Flavilitoribacter nigricans DSM 23189 = NBRC 102662]